MFEIEPLGDSAVTVILGEGIDADLNARVLALGTTVSAARIAGVTDVVPSYATLGIHYDPLAISFDALREQLEARMAAPPESGAEATESLVHVIPTRYDGPDLEDVARATGLSVREVIEIHSEREYRAFVIGFVPGWAYLGTIDERLRLPKRSSPRKRVPAGSVAIAEQQTGVYPFSTPGGWHLIGTTDVRMFDPGRARPVMILAGDRVRFEP